MKLLKKSNNTSDKITLAYLLLDMGNTNEAEIEIQKLEKLAPLYEKEVSQLKKYHHEIILIRSYQQSKNINAQAVMFNSPDYSFVSGDLVVTTPIQIPWQAGVQLYEQSYDGMSKSNIAPLIGYKTENSGIQYRYGVLQNSHEVLGQHVLTERSYLSGGMSLNTPFTDLYTVSFNDEIKRKNFIVNYSYIFKRHQFDVSYNYSYYNFEDDSFPSESRQVVNGLYQYNHMNHFLQGMSLSDMDFSSPSIGDVTFIPITLLSYRLGYNYTRGDFSLIPAISPGMDLQSSDTLGSYYTYEATAIYRFSLEKYLRLYWEHSNINQQNISQKNTTLMLNFNYWYY
jgi:hypothetical protein